MSLITKDNFFLRSDQVHLLGKVLEELIADPLEDDSQFFVKLWHHQFYYLEAVIPQKEIRRLN